MVSFDDGNPCTAARGSGGCHKATRACRAVCNAHEAPSSARWITLRSSRLTSRDGQGSDERQPHTPSGHEIAKRLRRVSGFVSGSANLSLEFVFGRRPLHFNELSEPAGNSPRLVLASNAWVDGFQAETSIVNETGGLGLHWTRARRKTTPIPDCVSVSIS
jgi:hypothetical protein